jgi:hypothetical protein
MYVYILAADAKHVKVSSADAEFGSPKVPPPSSEADTAEVNMSAGAESEPVEGDTLQYSPILQDKGKHRCLDDVVTSFKVCVKVVTYIDCMDI